MLVAPDKFKGTLTAAEAAAHIAAGVRQAAPGAEVRAFPVADGGEGTVAAALAAGYREVAVTVAGPTGLPVAASLAWDPDGGTAVVEAAQASGLQLLHLPPDGGPGGGPGGGLAPLTASSYGTGELLRHAVAALGARRIVLGLGGVACTDGGAGLAQALGYRLLDSEGRELPAGGAALADLARIEPPADALAVPPVVVATDVDNPLLGPTGAAPVYGPQKGADAAQVELLAAGLARWADVLAAATGRDLRDAPGAGAAGGLGFGVLTLLDAETRPGIGYLLDLLGFDAALARLTGTDLVITGEGRLDAQTLHGKAPAGVAAAAARAGVPVAAVTGRLDLGELQWRAAGFAAVAELRALPAPPDAPAADPLTAPAPYAREAGACLARLLLAG